MSEYRGEVVNVSELKLVGIPCVGLKDMGQKYAVAKESLFKAMEHMGVWRNRHLHYGVWPRSASQKNNDTHTYIVCVEVESFDGVPEWYVKLTLPAQRYATICDVPAAKAMEAYEAIEDYKHSEGLYDADGIRYCITDFYDARKPGTFSVYSAIED